VSSRGCRGRRSSIRSENSAKPLVYHDPSRFDLFHRECRIRGDEPSVHERDVRYRSGGSNIFGQRLERKEDEVSGLAEEELESFRLEVPIRLI
jgi:hypothetical protein